MIIIHFIYMINPVKTRRVRTHSKQYILSLHEVIGESKLFHYLSCHQDGFFLTDNRDEGRFSVVAVDPFDKVLLGPKTSSEELREAYNRVIKHQIDQVVLRVPFSGGAIGLVNFEYSYEKNSVKNFIDQSADHGMINFYNQVIVVDHVAQKTHLIYSNMADLNLTKAQAYQKLIELKKELQSCSSYKSSLPSVKSGPPSDPEGFKLMVDKIKEEIRVGNLFQCVVAEKREFEFSGHPVDLLEVLINQNNVPHLFYFQQKNKVVIGASPERLVQVGRSGKVRTCPIAGTRRRGSSPEQDEHNAQELRNCPKEQAEHLMLVDLSRNDLGKVCRPMSVKVRDYMHLKKFATVMHLVSEVDGILDRGQDALDAFDACFPAGTLSGAPKTEALMNIHRLEKGTRGAYGGALLIIDQTGSFDSVIIIRTMELNGRKGSYGVGAGVVADSHRDHEFIEICNKAQTIEKALREFE